MYTLSLSSLLVVLAATSDVSAAAHKRQFGFTSPLSYAPVPAACPATPLTRAASSGLGTQEAAWIKAKKPLADAALKSWLAKTGTFKATTYPNIASAVAGGYLRASLLGAGIHQELDNVESSGPMAGLLQAIQYETTLSGSAAYLGGLMQNNWPSVASLSTNLWEPNYAYGQSPGAANGTVAQAATISLIVAECGARTAAGFPVTIIDIYGRIIGYSNLYNEGGVASTMSGTQSASKFANHQVPYPIMTSVGTIDNGVNCHPGSNATQYELAPFEFGSWDQGVAAFANMKYLGTTLNNGKPVALCTSNFDNIGLMIGTSANTISKSCSNLDTIDPALNDTVNAVEEAATFSFNRQYYSAIPNPFFGSATSPMVAQNVQLALVDGGDSGQVIPLWPLLNRANVDVTFVWDNYYDAPNAGTTGGQLVDTYGAAKKANLKRMPVIPPKATFKAKGLNMHPVAFGCNNKAVQTFIYVPYQQYIKQTQKTGNLTTTPQQTRDYITDGNLLANNNNNANWPKCVGCLIMKKSATTLPSYCAACFTQYCYN